MTADLDPSPLCTPHNSPPIFILYWDGGDDCLVKWVGTGTPVCEEETKADSLEEAGQNPDGDCVDRSVLDDEAGDELKTC